MIQKTVSTSDQKKTNPFRRYALGIDGSSSIALFASATASAEFLEKVKLEPKTYKG